MVLLLLMWTLYFAIAIVMIVVARVPLLCCCCLCVTIAIAIVGLRSGCSCCSGRTWREGRVGNALDRGRVDVVDDAKGLLPVPVRVPLLY